MMPRLDGFGLLSHLRADPLTAAIPVIMLSARAGEEARSEGMEAGADDYLVKPFTARELMARVGAHIAMYRLRSELTAKEQQQRVIAEAAEAQYRDILESISEGFVFVDHAWTVRYMNHQSEVLSGRRVDDVVGKLLWEEFPGLEVSPFGAALHQALKTGEKQSVEDLYPPLDRWFYANIYPSPDGVSIFIQDVSEKRRQQQQLLVTEKLAATGRLAATIAHEINNPLESVLNLLYLSRISRSATREKINEYLLTAEQELTRVSQIARHTLGFYRDTSVPSEVDLARVLDDVLTIYNSRLSAANIQVVKQFQPVPPLHALRGELHQIFSNLVSNAIDAMRGGGRLLLSLTEDEHEGRPGIRALVEDNGSGIAEKNLDRLFEPFFTTKVSVGTGLGLWVVKQFIQDHGGAITVESTTGVNDHGTRFMIFLPLSSQVTASQRVM
jgi:PAS domain S-box-containing protein